VLNSNFNPATFGGGLILEILYLFLWPKLSLCLNLDFLPCHHSHPDRMAGYHQREKQKKRVKMNGNYCKIDDIFCLRLPDIFAKYTFLNIL